MADLSVQNPIEELRLAALDAFPDLDCTVEFAEMPAEGPYGETLWPDDAPDRAAVTVSVGIPMEGVIEVMAHELAHVVAGIEADHGPEWEAAFAKIHAAYCARMEAPALVSSPGKAGAGAALTPAQAAGLAAGTHVVVPGAMLDAFEDLMQLWPSSFPRLSVETSWHDGEVELRASLDSEEANCMFLAAPLEDGRIAWTCGDYGKGYVAGPPEEMHEAVRAMLAAAQKEG